VDYVVDQMTNEKVIGWLQGRMEFGPRALGARSIIGDARSTKMQSVMNLKIKFRESFRPFAPIVLQEHVDRWFEMRPFEDSPYMLLVAPVNPEQRVSLEADERKVMQTDPDLRKRVNVARSSIPAVTHVDYSARIQTVDPLRHGRFHRLLRAFEAASGCGVLVNTSFNVRGEPIVCTPGDACECFLATDMDALVVENWLVLKDSVPQRLRSTKQAAYLARFSPD